MGESGVNGEGMVSVWISYSLVDAWEREEYIIVGEQWYVDSFRELFYRY